MPLHLTDTETYQRSIWSSLPFNPSESCRTLEKIGKELFHCKHNTKTGLEQLDTSSICPRGYVMIVLQL